MLVQEFNPPPLVPLLGEEGGGGRAGKMTDRPFLRHSGTHLFSTNRPRQKDGGLASLAGLIGFVMVDSEFTE